MKNIKSSKDFSISKLEELQNVISLSETISTNNDFCIYTTGSFGREEAGHESDIDLFFIYHNEENKFSKIQKILIDAELIKLTKELSFPDFSGDGEYLEVHNLNEIHKELGSRNDDYLNYFTARMLLILESKYLHNEKLYEEIIDKILDKYYVDFNKNETFHPMFLINDIIRFWRTLCLNYEYGRKRKNETNLPEDEFDKQKIKAHIKNYKLKFSRKLTCYSLMLLILFSNENLNKSKIKEFIKLSPINRLKYIYDNNEDYFIKDSIDKILELYDNFLNITHKTKADLDIYISNKKNRDKAFDDAREFSTLIFKLMIHKKDDEKLKYFLV
jgi:predicted nucleotidyltransferase